MNSSQRTVVVIGAILIILSFLFPHWIGISTGNASWRYRYDAGYSFLFEPPDKKAMFDYFRLTAQASVIVILTGGALLYFRDRKEVEQ